MPARRACGTTFAVGSGSQPSQNLQYKDSPNRTEFQGMNRTPFFDPKKGVPLISGSSPNRDRTNDFHPPRSVRQSSLELAGGGAAWAPSPPTLLLVRAAGAAAGAGAAVKDGDVL